MTENKIILKDLYKEYFRLGAACEKINERFKNHEIGNPEKEALLKEHFNSITFANELKPAYNMGFNSPDATEENLPFVINPYAKAMLDWAKENGVSVRGHVLVWHSQCPKEVFCKGYNPVTFPTDPELLKQNPMMKHFEKLNPVCYVDRDTMLKRLKSYIFSLMDYMYKNGYAELIYAWDVVNEAIELQDKTPTGLRNSYWYQVIGDDFIYWAFLFANQAVDVARDKYSISARPKLFYNDYNEWQPEKKAAIIGALTREGNGHGSIISEKLIDGIGMQGHLSDNNNVEEYLAALKEYASLVNEVHVTELDVKCTCSNKNAEYYQAVFYKSLFAGFVEAKKSGANLTCVTLWGLTDDNSWIRDANPLLFHGDLSPKRSFDALVYALSGESLGEPEEIKIDLSDRHFEFAETEGGQTPGNHKQAIDNSNENNDCLKFSKAKLEQEVQKSFKFKGFGQFQLQSDVVHSGKYALGCERHFGDWSGIGLDLSDFIGQTIRIRAWGQTSAKALILKAMTGEKMPVVAKTAGKDKDWVLLEGKFKVPNNLHSMQFLFTTEEETPEKFSPFYIDDIDVELIGLEESFEEETNIASIRGVGHLPFCFVTDKESVDGKGHSYCITRHEKDATVKFNVGAYIGNKISFTAFVKTADKKIKLGLDGAVSKEYACVDSAADGWTKISAEMELPSNLKSAEVYIETDGSADYYVDDIFVERK